MNILHVTPYYAPAWGFGGVVRAVHGLTVALAARGHQVTVLTTDASGDGLERLPDGEHQVDGVRVIRCRNISAWLHRYNFSTPVNLPGQLHDLLPETDVVHLHEFRTIENLNALRLAKRYGVPVVMSPHGTIGYQAGRTGLKRYWDQMFGAWMAQRITAAAVLTNNERDETAQLWQSFGMHADDVVQAVIPNGIDPAKVVDLPPRGTFRATWHIPADAPLLLFLGRLHVRKGAQDLVSALSTLPGAHLAIVGPDEGQLATLEAMVTAMGLTERVHFTGLLTGQDKMAALRDADVLGLPAIGEGLPMVVLEAMACGLPVAISEGCNMPEVIDAGAGVLVEAGGDARQNASMLEPVLADAARRARMGAAGKALVAARYTWAQVAESYEGLYQKINRGG